MTRLTPYLTLPGTAREALEFYQSVFGGDLQVHTAAEMGDPERGDAVAHGMLVGPVDLFASDAEPGQPSLSVQGLLFSLLGTAEPETLRRWFDALAAEGTDVDPLQQRPWGDHDGQVTDRFGVRWLIGFQG